MRTLVPGLAVTALLAAAPAASAADQTVQAVDATAENPTGNVWAPTEVTINPGDTVTWNFNGTSIAHNVAAASANWTFDSPFHNGSGTESFTFAETGTYEFVCEVHPDTMTGRVLVTDESGNPPPDPPDEPPPGPGEQPWGNDWQSDGVFESGGLDRDRPALRALRVRGARNGARVRFRVSERAKVKLRVKLFGITLKTMRVRAAGREKVRIRGFRAGRYQLVVRAIDPAGNRSRAITRTVRFK